MPIITEFEVIDRGVDHPDYFIPNGTSSTRWDGATYGIGTNAQEAYDDAVNMLSSTHDVSVMPEFVPFAYDAYIPELNEPESECYYHVCIRYKESGE